MSKQVILTIPDNIDLSALREMKLILRYYKDGNDLYEYSTDSFSLSEAKGDLISREALKKKIQEIVENEIPFDPCQQWALGLRYALKLIDNFPTVRNEYMRGYEAAEREYKRPKGKWIIADKVLDYYHECPFCHWRNEVTTKSFKYCPICGADMRGGNE